MPISLLPEEIFIEIAEILVLPHNDLRAPRLTTLRLVCRRWDESIQQTPSFWTYIWNGTNNTYVERALQRSGTLGLKVRVSLWPKVKNRDKGRFWSAVLPHVDRWEHAELSGKIGDSIPQVLAHTPAPRLRTLALDSRGAEDIDGLFPWPLPNLESLRVQDFAVPWSPQHFPTTRLKHLYIDLNRRRLLNPTLTLVEIFDTLRECQELISLHLTGIPFIGHIPQEKLTPISLPYLEVISVGSFLMPIECKLLETIHTPKCRLIVLRPWYRWLSTIDKVLMALETLAGRIGTAKIPHRAALEAEESEYETHLGCNLTAVEDGDSFMCLRLEVDAQSPYDRLLEEAGPFFHRWASAFGPTTGWDVQVTSNSLGSMDGMLSAFATHFPMASTLVITRPAIPWYVLEPTFSLFDSTGEFAFPCLEQLEIWYCRPLAKGITQIITRRVIRGDTQRDEVTPLRMLINLPRDMDEIERVELTWLEDQVANLTIEATDVVLYEL